MVESVINYGIIIWGGIHENQLKPLEIAQKYILKIILHKNKRFPTIELFQITQVMNIRTLYIFNAAKFMYKNPQLRILVDHDYHTRSKVSATIHVPKSNKTLYKKHIRYTGTKIYNKLPNFIKCYNNISLFSKSVKNYILNNFELFSDIL